MIPDDDRTTQWIACLLGDLPPEATRQVEQEMRDDPEKAEEIKQLLGAVTDWAKRPGEHVAIDLEELANRTRAAEGIRRRRPPFRTLWPWALAASILIVAMTQATFSIQVGDAVLHWGGNSEAHRIDLLKEDIATLSKAYAVANEEKAEFAVLLDALVAQTLELEANLQYATSELAQRQLEESRIRYIDMQRLLELTNSARFTRTFAGPEIVQAEY